MDTIQGLLVRPVTEADRAEWLRMREALWPSQPVDRGDEHAREIDAFFAQADPALTTFVAVRPDGTLGGFLEASTQSYADGCDSSPVGYIEGWYVDPDLRRSGVGAALVHAAEAWAHALGLTEMASDAEIDNTISLHAHLALGYAEVGRVVQFRKAITDLVGV